MFIRRYLQCFLVANLNFGWTVLRIANAGEGVFAELIRSYSQRQMKPRGIQYTDALMQEASNRVATKALADIMTYARRVGDNRWEFPAIEEIANKEATGVGEIVSW
jgi:hypothetical protein